MIRKPEVLSPAGDRASMEAAVKAGADAVYFGLQAFNARHRATNFHDGELSDTVRFLHTHEVKAYVTLNTLVFDHEIDEIKRLLLLCREAEVDALIVQDLGVVKLAKQLTPDLALHASTQMTCTDAASVTFAESMGIKRVVLARELSLEDIEDIQKKTKLELEVFVHGALCIAYSGQCLTSEAIGGRSANRGACAQACRLPYELLVDGKLMDLGEKSFLLSPSDLEASSLVEKLTQIGVSSLKIEGRLKSPAYVGATTKLYRYAVDMACLSSMMNTAKKESLELLEQRREQALQMYSRGSGPGFFYGVNHQKLVEGKNSDHRGRELGVWVASKVEKGRHWIGVNLHFRVQKGDGILVEGSSGGKGEFGGRVWQMVRDGLELDAAEKNDFVFIWLGPDKKLTFSEPHRCRRVFKTSDPKMEKTILSDLKRQAYAVELDIDVDGEIGSNARFFVRTSREAEVTIYSDVPLSLAHKKPLCLEVMRDKLDKLNGTPYQLRRLRSNLPSDAYLPLSSLNHVRKKIVLELSKKRAHGQVQGLPLVHLSGTEFMAPYLNLSKRGKSYDIELHVLCRNREQVKAAIEAGASGVYLDFLELNGTRETVDELCQLKAEQKHLSQLQIGLAPPRIQKPGEEKIAHHLDGLFHQNRLVRALGHLPGYLESPKKREWPRCYVGDFSLNLTNHIAIRELLGRGLDFFTPSHDLDEKQLLELIDDEIAPYTEFILHHSMPLFYMEHCIFAASLSTGRSYRDCQKPCESHTLHLRDRTGTNHPVFADVSCRNTVFHGAKQSSAHLAAPMRKRGVSRFRIELSCESKKSVTTLVDLYLKLLRGEINATLAWSMMRAETNDKVVRGSLRVLPSTTA